MGVQSRSLETKIQPLVLSLVGGDTNTRVVNQFVALCHRMATRYITMKANKASWYQQIQTEKINDLAWDSIAELFRTDDDGRLTCLVDYYQSMNLEKITEGELYSATRRLIFRKVNDSLFRFMHDYDPSLSKIIRNVKLAVKECKDVSLVRRWNTYFLIFEDGVQNGMSVTGWMPPEILNARLLPFLTTKENLHDVITQAHDIITSQDDYVHAYPLIPLCLIIRESHIFLQDPIPHSVKPVSSLLQDDVSHIIHSSITYLKTGLRQRYVQTGKIDENTFDNYFDGIRDYYIDSYVFFIEDIPYFTYIKKYLPGLTYSLYRNYHRKYVEYLMRLSRSHIQQQLGKVL